LSEKSREAWFAAIESAREAGKIDFAVSFQSEKSIDKNGISFCIKKCIADGLTEIIQSPNGGFAPDFHSDNFLILLDGGLKAPAHFRNQKTIIHGDDKEPIIALASITAKVLRDRRMRSLAKKYPDYDFDQHKGYGTAAHYAAIEKYGLSPIHRKSFLKKLG
jgi:ribonuclease HII